MIGGGTLEMGRVTVDVDLANHEDVILCKAGRLADGDVRRVRISGIVDTGASYLVIPKSVAARLGVPPAGKATVRDADRRTAKRDVVKDVDVELLGRQGTFKAVVEPKREDILIGAIVLEDLDLLVDCQHQRLQPRDPGGIVAELE